MSDATRLLDIYSQILTLGFYPRTNPKGPIKQQWSLAPVEVKSQCFSSVHFLNRERILNQNKVKRNQYRFYFERVNFSIYVLDREEWKRSDKKIDCS